MKLKRFYALCSFRQVASIHASQKLQMGNKNHIEKFNVTKSSVVEDGVKRDKSYIDILGKAEKTLFDPSQQRLSRTMYNLIKSMVFHDGQMKFKTPALKARRPVVNTKSFSSRFIKHFNRNDLTKDLPEIQDCFKSSPVENDEELKRLFLYQECLQNEIPFYAEIPNGIDQSTFLKNPKDWELEMTAIFPMKQKTFRFLLLKWAVKNKSERKKARKKLEFVPREMRPDDDYPVKLLPRFNNTHLGHWNINKHISSIHHCQPLVIDMRFHKEKDQYSLSLMTQMHYMFRKNFDSPFPFHIVLANFEKNSDFYQKVWKKSAIAGIDNVIINSENSLLDLEPEVRSEDLVYLSPDATDVLSEFDCSKVYVIGGLVDRLVHKRRTKTISTTEGISSVKLPLHLYLKWGGIGNKMELTVNVVFEILNTLKLTGSWIKALSCIPYRLHSGLTDLGQELANYDPEIISRFAAGERWKTKKSLKSPTVLVSQRHNKATSAYLGK